MVVFVCMCSIRCLSIYHHVANSLMAVYVFECCNDYCVCVDDCVTYVMLLCLIVVMCIEREILHK